MVKAMLNYGAKAQTYFDYNADNLANAGYELTEQVQLPSDVVPMEISGQVSGISFYGATLLFRNRIAVRFYLNGDSIDGLTFTANGSEVTADIANGKYYVEVDDINPQELDENISFAVSNGTDTLNVTYSPMNYIVRMSAKDETSAELKSLLSAMYGYHTAAKAFIEIEETNPEITIASYTFTGSWVYNRNGDTAIGPEMSYDGNESTKWNPGANTGYNGEPGIIYTLDGWYDLETVQCNFGTADALQIPGEW